jgi:hypothetical protein
MAESFSFVFDGEWFDAWGSSADFTVCHMYTSAAVIKPTRIKKTRTIDFTAR